MKNIFLFLKSKKLHFYNTLILLYKTLIIGFQKEKNKKIRTIFCIAYWHKKKKFLLFQKAIRSLCGKKITDYPNS